jgi:cytochrome c peroxidase
MRTVQHTGIVFLIALSGLAAGAAAALPPVITPPENPITEAKRVLGKALFWDEQLSSDNTMACATCHTSARAGTDGRRIRLPGLDGIPNTPDDTFGSPGTIRSDVNDNYITDPIVGVNPQGTTRTSMTTLMAAFSPVANFWDGRATGAFRDPITNQLLIAANGALESQAVGPPVSSVEMGHDNRNWPEIVSKIQSARPLALARQIPSDLLNEMNASTTYAELFTRAFGSAQVTAGRIAFAIATYERTLVPDQTPWDRFIAGDPTAMTQGQVAGWNFFRNNTCNACHTAQAGPNNPGLFTSNTFRNIGVRPPQEDLGRQLVTGNPADRGRFKVPSLRNVGLKNSFMHNGQFTTIPQVVAFYARAPGSPPQFPDNQDPLMANTNVPPQVAPALQDFLINALTDPRVANRTFPFDHPNLWSTRPNDKVIRLTGGVPGTGGTVPNMISATPPFVGNVDFKLGLSAARPNAQARLAVSFNPPVAGRVAEDKVVGPFALSASGVGTAHLPIGDNGTLGGRTLFAQWIVADPAALGGFALSIPVQITFFCGDLGCPTRCIADIDDGSEIGFPDGGVTVDDLLFYLARFESGSILADVDDGSATGTADGGVTIDDLLYYLVRFEAGC